MKAPTTYEEAEILAERLELSVSVVLLAYNIVSPDSQDLLRRLDIAVINNDINQMWQIYEEGAEDNDNACIVVKVLEKILAATSDVKEMWKVYRCAPHNSKLGADALNEILLYAKCTEEMWRVYCSANCSVIRTNALRKIMNSSQDLGVLRRVYEAAPSSSDIKLRSLKKLVELSPEAE